MVARAALDDLLCHVILRLVKLWKPPVRPSLHTSDAEIFIMRLTIRH
jgi:hypothetical protein